MNIIFLAEWLSKKSVRDFAISEKMIKSFEKCLTYMPDSDPTKISLNIEQAVMTYFIAEEIESTCASLLSEEDQQELLEMTSKIAQSTQALRAQHTEAFDIIACDLANDLKKKQALKKLLQV